MPATRRTGCPTSSQALPQQVITVVPAGAGVGIMKEQYGRSLQILLGVCGLVLLIACANVANLLLARAVARRGQTAVRLAMGASRRQIVTQALVESMLLALAGALAGLVVAVGAARLLLCARIRRRDIPANRHDAVAARAGVRHRPRADHRARLRRRAGMVRHAHRSHRRAARRRPHHRRPLVVRAQGAAGRAGDAVGGARRRIDDARAQPGQPRETGLRLRRFDSRVLVQLNRPPATYTAERLTALYRDVEERLHRLPGMQGAGLALYNPLTDNWGELVLVAGHPPPKPGEQAGASWDRVSANYLQQLGVKLVRGRHFAAADNETAENVAVVNEAFVERFFKTDEDPLDQHFGLDLPENVNTYRIVGIVRDAKFAGFALDQPARPMFFVRARADGDYTHPLMKRLEFAVTLRRAACCWSPTRRRACWSRR